jgi:hypothetical protein
LIVYDKLIDPWDKNETFVEILFIVMIGAFTGNVDVRGMVAPPPVLDLPANTPGLQNGGNAVAHNGTNCIHVIVSAYSDEEFDVMINRCESDEEVEDFKKPSST